MFAFESTGCNKDEAESPSAAESAPAPTQAAATPAPGGPAEPSPPSGLLAVGAPIPDLTAATQSGERLSLASLKGKPVVVYFYPKDDTPGCTVEAKGFRDMHADFEAEGAVVLGVSLDDEQSHRAFADKYELPFRLLADDDGAVTRAFGVKARAGFAERVTFLIDKDGKVAKVWPRVAPDTHATDVLAAVRAL